MEENLKLVDPKKHHKEDKKCSDPINILTQVKLGYLKFYVEKNYIYCENTITKERVVVGDYNITIGIDIGPTSPDKMFEALATIDAGSVSRTRGVYHD